MVVVVGVGFCMLVSGCVRQEIAVIAVFVGGGERHHVLVFRDIGILLLLMLFCRCSFCSDLM